MKPSALVVASVALAISTGQAAADPETDARQLFERGNALVDIGDLAAAEEAFAAALAAHPRAKIRLNLAAVQMELGKHAEAANQFAAYLESDEATQDKSSQVEALLAELDQKLGFIEIIAEGEGQLRLDGEPIATGPGRVERRCVPGHHTVSFERHAGSREDRTVDAHAGEQLSVRFAASVLEVETATVPPTVAPATTPSTDPAHDLSITERFEPAMLSVFSRVDIDLGGSGAVWAPGVGLRAARHLTTYAAGLIGGRAGLEVGAAFALETGALQPTVFVALPTFYERGLRPGVAGGAGLVARLSRFEIMARAGVSHALSVPEQFEATVLILSLSVGASL